MIYTWKSEPDLDGGIKSDLECEANMQSGMWLPSAHVNSHTVPLAINGLQIIIEPGSKVSNSAQVTFNLSALKNGMRAFVKLEAIPS